MLKKLINIKYSGIIFSLFLFLNYGIIPILFNGLNDISFKLFILSFISSFTIFLFFMFPVNNIKFNRIYLNRKYFNTLILFFWILTIFVLFFTATKIPLIGLIEGLQKEELHKLRELFLKAREGWEMIFVYLNYSLTSLLIPYVIVSSFVNDSKYRWYFVILFFFYSISFLEKAFFLKIAIPFVYFYFLSKYYSSKKSYLIILVVILVLYFSFVITSSSGDNGCQNDYTKFLTNDYIPCDPLSFFIWRTFAVPIFTALDSIEVFYSLFNSEYLYGATSTITSFLTSQDKIYFERLVFEFQWGQNLTGTGSSNAVYFIDAYINFGYVGVFLISSFIGLLLRFMKNSNDLALQSLWPLIGFSLYVGSILGLIFSGGGIIMLLIFLIFKFNKN